MLEFRLKSAGKSYPLNGYNWDIVTRIARCVKCHLVTRGVYGILSAVQFYEYGTGDST